MKFFVALLAFLNFSAFAQNPYPVDENHTPPNAEALKQVEQDKQAQEQLQEEQEMQKEEERQEEEAMYDSPPYWEGQDLEGDLQMQEQDIEEVNQDLNNLHD